MAKYTFTAKELEQAIEGMMELDKKFPDYPISSNLNEYNLWEEENFPVTLKKVGKDSGVTVHVHEYFGGEEGGDHGMYVVFRVGHGLERRFFEKTGEYNSWDDSTWDGPMTEVVPEEVKVTKWVAKK